MCANSGLWPVTCINGLRLRDKIKTSRSYPAMSIEKKSLISTLKTTKKANAASSAAPEASQIVSKRQLTKRQLSKRQLTKRQLTKRQLTKRAID